jgi:hypothetical protein
MNYLFVSLLVICLDVIFPGNVVIMYFIIFFSQDDEDLFHGFELVIEGYILWKIAENGVKKTATKNHRIRKYTIFPLIDK